MTNLQKTILLLLLLSFTSCKKNEDEYIFDKNRFENIENLKLDKAVELIIILLKSEQVIIQIEIILFFQTRKYTRENKNFFKSKLTIFSLQTTV
jgi:hypothetical protein